MLTKEELEEIRERCEKATQGPWYHRQAGMVSSKGEEYDWISSTEKHDRPTKTILGRECLYGGTSDYAFIASSRTDIPKLLAHIEELEKSAIKWIPVSERPPLDHQHVLIRCDGGYVRSAIWHDFIEGSFRDKGFSPEENWYVVLAGVTHWAELPQGPKEE